MDTPAMPSKERSFRPDQHLERLYRIHAQAAVRFAYLLTGESEVAQDFVQDAFIAISQRAGVLDDSDAFAAYLRTTVLNLARMHFRHRAVERAYLSRQHDVADQVFFPDASYVEIRQSLFRLPYRQRAAIVLRFYEDLPEREIADLLGCRPGTVKSLLSRGLVALRTENIQPDGEGDSHA